MGGSGCLALVQVVGAAALRARVPAAFARGELLLRGAASGIASELRGRAINSSARGQVFWFEDETSAVRFGSRLQDVLVDMEWPATLLVRPEAAVERGEGVVLFRGLRARVAIHAGRLDLDEANGVDGPGLYQLSRIASVAHGGQVVVSAPVAARIDRVPGIVVRSLGSHVLTGVDGETTLYEAQSSRLSDRTFPEVWSQSNRRSNLAPSDESPQGRHGDLGALTELLALGVRTVVVTGPPGVGKRVLVGQFARARMIDPKFVGGTWYLRVEAQTVGSLVRATGWALGIPLDEATSPSWAVQQLGFALGARGRLLLVIDGLLDPPPDVVATLDQWIRVAPRLTCVIPTTRRLFLTGEVVYDVRPLPIPTGDSQRNADVVRIYASHARGVDDDFVVEDPAVVARVVEQVGGLPLAVRLLAGFVDRFPPDQQLERLSSGAVEADGLIDALLDLLDPEEWAVLVAATALPGSFDARSLEDLGTDPLPVIERLERRGMVRPNPDFGAPQVYRYQVDSPIRDRVLRRMPAEEHGAMRERRAHQLVRWCERTGRSADSPDRSEIVARLAVEWEGLLEAVAIGIDPQRDESESVELALRTCLALEPLLEARGPLFLGLELLDGVLKRCDAILGSDPLLQQRVLVARARALRRRGRGAAARADLERALSIAERWSDAEGTTVARVEQGRLALDTGAAEGALALLESLAATCAERGDGANGAQAVALLGAAAVALGRFDDAEARLSAAASELGRLQVPRERARALGWLAGLLQRTGRFGEAADQYGIAIDHLRELGIRGAEARARAELGLVLIHLGRLDEAEGVLEVAVGLARMVGDRRVESAALRHQGLQSIAAGAMELARERLLEALAIDRDRGDRRSEGTDLGWVGIVSHLLDHAEPARESYRRAILLLEQSEESGMRALFCGWYAALEAEALDPQARGLFETALLRHAETADPSIGEVLLELRGALDLLEAAAAEGRSEMGSAARWRRLAAERWEDSEARRGRLSFDARLAHDRVGQRLRPPVRSS